MWVCLQELQYEPFRLGGNCFPDGAIKVYPALLNIVDHFAVGTAGEWELAGQHFIQYNTSGPHVCQRAIADATADIHSYVWSGTNHGGEHITIDALFRYEIGIAKVAQCDGHWKLCGGAENVVRTYVAMNYILAMNIVESCEELSHNNASVRFWKFLVLCEKVGESATTHELKNDVVLVGCGKHIDCMHNGTMVEHRVDMTLADNPLHGLNVMGAFLDDFDSKDMGGIFHIVCVVDAGEGALCDEGAECVVAFEATLGGKAEALGPALHFLKGAAMACVKTTSSNELERAFGFTVAKVDGGADNVEFIVGGVVLAGVEGEHLALKLGKAGLTAGETADTDAHPAAHADGHAIAQVGIVGLGGSVGGEGHGCEKARAGQWEDMRVWREVKFGSGVAEMISTCDGWSVEGARR